MTTVDNVDQRRTDRRLAVDRVYRELDEYKIQRRRITFIHNDEKRLGGYGVVRQARLHTSTHLPMWIASRLHNQPQIVAVKELKLSSMHNESDLKRAFTKEVLVWTRLKGHPGIAKFLGYCVDFGRREAWLISPWEPYGNVNEFIKGRELEVPEKLSLAFDTIDALAFLHQLDPPICHGDIKPANVLVNTQCRAILCDFGLSRLYEDSEFRRLESTAMGKGSIRWCSPELLDGGPRTASSDIYAWAWLVWEIMTGEIPYGDAVKEYVIVCKILTSPLSGIDGESRLRECLQLWSLMTRCWSPEPLERPTSAMCRAVFEYLPHCPPTPSTVTLHSRSATLLQSLGDLESWKGNHKAGFAYLEQALRLHEIDGNDRGIASVLLKQAIVAYRDSNHIKLGSAASAALEKCWSLQDDIGVANALYWMAYAEPKIEDALHDLQESLNIFRTEENRLGVAKCLEYLGELYRQQGQTAQALSTLGEAIEVASHFGDKLTEANALDSLGLTHWTLHHNDQAISAFQRAHEIARRIGWEHGLSSFLCRLGSVKLDQGIHAEAAELLRESVDVARKSNAGWRLGQALRRLGACFRAQGRLEEAISVLEESYSVYHSLALGFQWEQADAAALLAASKSTLGHQEEALTWYDRAVDEYRKGGAKYEGKISTHLAAKEAITRSLLPGKTSS